MAGPWGRPAARAAAHRRHDRGRAAHPRRPAGAGPGVPPLAELRPEPHTRAGGGSLGDTPGRRQTLAQLSWRAMPQLFGLWPAAQWILTHVGQQASISGIERHN